MQAPSLVQFIIFIALLLGSHLSFVGALPSNGGRSSGSLVGQRWTEQPPEVKYEERSTSLSLRAKPGYPENYRYRLHNSQKSIIFSEWGDEFPRFDDVADMLDKAVEKLRQEINSKGYNEAMPAIWQFDFEGAHLMVMNGERADGVSHLELIDFLEGLQSFGEQFGFFRCYMHLENRQKTLSARGRAVLSFRRSSATAQQGITATS
ncbi:MAG: hypothetical protein Q9219_003570 [cf. Caloplaca sp. 3 TL-2023]